MSPVPIALIAAVAQNGIIGSENGIPWRLPTDFAFFKRMSVGKPLIMGRRTFEGIGKPLPDRVNIIVTRTQGYQPDGVIVVSDIEAALDHAQTIAMADKSPEVMIGGGGEIYAATIERADRLYITHVDLEPIGDTMFPPIDPTAWHVVDTPGVEPGPKDSATFRVKVYERR
jgi:dihydrofolate reductase